MSSISTWDNGCPTKLQGEIDVNMGKETLEVTALKQWGMGRSATRTIAAAGALAMLATLITPAQADDPAEAAIIDAIEALAPDPQAGLGNNDNLEVPLDPQEPITLSAEDEFGDIALSLPEGLDEGRSLDAENTVFTSDDETPTVTVQSTDEGYRVVSVAETEEQATDLTYEFDENLTLVPQPDGSIELVAAEEVEELGAVIESTVGEIEAPWAVDGNGDPLQTHFEVNGSSLTQVVTTDESTVYPVVADPEVRRVRLIQWRIRFNRNETRSISGGSTAAAITACIGGITAATGGAGAAVGAALCGTLGAAILWNANIAENSRPKQCVQIHWTTVPNIIWVNRYTGGYCR